jgi:hypothetical protein
MIFIILPINYSFLAITLLKVHGKMMHRSRIFFNSFESA